MTRPPVPPQRTLRSIATRKRMAAERHEREALRLRAEAHELDRRWRTYISDQPKQVTA